MVGGGVAEEEEAWEGAVSCLPGNSMGHLQFTICNPGSETKGLTWNRHTSHNVLTPSIRLGGVDSSWFKKKLGISVLIKTAPAASVVMATAPRMSCFFLLG